MASLDISEPKPDEFAAIIALCQPQEAQESTEGLAVTAQMLQRLRSSPRSAMLVARNQEQIVGVIMVGRLDGRTIQRLVVAQGDQDQPDQPAAPGQQDQDIQRALIDKVLVKLSAQGVHTFPFALEDAQENMMLWHNAKWQGQAELNKPSPSKPLPRSAQTTLAAV